MIELRDLRKVYGDAFTLVKDLLGHRSEQTTRTIYLEPLNGIRLSMILDGGEDLDGILAKRLDAPYASGERTAMVKVKQIRTADCVVGGFRYARGTRIVGSLLLGLYGDDGLLHHVGFTSAFTKSQRRELTKRFEALKKQPGFTGNAPGGPSRWSTDRTGEWEPVAPRVVAEVAHDHFSGGRFRHGTKFLHWRPDKSSPVHHGSSRASRR